NMKHGSAELGRHVKRGEKAIEGQSRCYRTDTFGLSTKKTVLSPLGLTTSGGMRIWLTRISIWAHSGMEQTRNNHRDALLRLGYFPKELPPTFHTLDFADYVQKLGTLRLVGPTAQPLVSTPATHNLARPGQLRRTLKICNPFNQYELAHIIA